MKWHKNNIIMKEKTFFTVILLTLYKINIYLYSSHWILLLSLQIIMLYKLGKLCCCHCCKLRFFLFTESKSYILTIFLSSKTF